MQLLGDSDEVSQLPRLHQGLHQVIVSPLTTIDTRTVSPPTQSILDGYDSTGDLWRSGRLADKVYGAFVSSASTHGGQETTLTNFTTIFTHWGGIIVPPGFTAPVPVVEQMQSGNPHGASHVAGFGNPPTEFALDAARYQAGRAVKVAAQLTSDLTSAR